MAGLHGTGGVLGLPEATTYGPFAELKLNSASLDFVDTEGGTRFTHAEHGVHLDGFDDGSQREQGTSEIHNALAWYLTSDIEGSGPG